MPDVQSPDWKWWCIECLHFTEKAPCEHCGAGHENVLVIEPGQTPPRTVEDADDFGDVLEYDWADEVYADA